MILKPKQKGVMAIFIVILVMSLMFIIANTLSFMTFGQQKISNIAVKLAQSYYLAESGIEDALLKLKINPFLGGTSYNLQISGGSVFVSITEVIGGARTIISQSNFLNSVKKIKVVYEVSKDEAGFFYGCQVGDGGMEMGTNSRVKGNVFSNGSVIASQKGYIDNSLVVANPGTKMKDLEVGDYALVHNCENSTIGKTLTYIEGGSVSDCSAQNTMTQTDQINPEPLPISQEKINQWRDETSVNIITNDVNYSGSGNVFNLGPAQIGTLSSPKNLTVVNGAKITVRGTIYVTGDINFDNNAIIELDPMYGSYSGIVIADGKITIGNNAILKGTGQQGSYLLLISTNSSLSSASPAILVNNNAEGAIFYTNNGLIYLKNNMIAREITGYKVVLNNNAEVIYESGLQNAIFSSGPGGGWKIKSWEETQ